MRVGDERRIGLGFNKIILFL